MSAAPKPLPMVLLVLLPTLARLVVQALAHRTPEQLAAELETAVVRAVPADARPVVGAALVSLGARIAEHA